VRVMLADDVLVELLQRRVPARPVRDHALHGIRCARPCCISLASSPALRCTGGV
jgi:hypothetical protein